MELLLAILLIAAIIFIVGVFATLPFALIARAKRNKTPKPLDE